MELSGSGVVGLAACRSNPDVAADDLFPDGDSELLAYHLGVAGLTAVRFAWDDVSVGVENFDAVVVRSTWDSVDRPVEFLEWVETASQQTLLVNSAEMIRWNLDKRYLRDLEDGGLPVVPTQWVQSGEIWAVPSEAFVVKPAVSAGARDTVRFSGGNSDALAHATAIGERGGVAMVQRYLPSVESLGEISIVTFDGIVSHAVKKGAFLEPDAPTPERPWEQMTYLGRVEPPSDIVAVADEVSAMLRRRFGCDPAFARVDVVRSDDNEPLVLEVELIDPVLSLADHPPAAASLAATIARLV